MRGDDQQTGHLFSYLSPEQRVPADHPLRAIRRMTDAALTAVVAALRAMYSQTGRPSIPPEQAAAGVAAADSVLGAQRAAVDGAAGVQPAVPLVRRPGDGRRGVDADDVHEESRAVARRRHRAAFFAASGGAGARGRGCCRTSISRWMARCSRRGPG